MFNYVTPTITYPEPQTTTINGSRWYITPDGTFPSVTTMLSYEVKPWFEQWKSRVGAKEARKESDRASIRGTAVHKMCELYLQNKDPDDIMRGQQRDYIRLFNQIKMALNKRINNIRAQELALWSKTLNLAGRTDCIAEYDGKLSVIDFKTAKNVKGEETVQDYFLQSTAYALMYHEMYGERIDNIVVIITAGTGLMPTVFIKQIDPYIEPLIIRSDKFLSSVK